MHADTQEQEGRSPGFQGQDFLEVVVETIDLRSDPGVEGAEWSKDRK